MEDQTEVVIRTSNLQVSSESESIPLFYPRGCAAPQRGIAPIATLERFVVYCSYEQNILAAPPGAAQRARGIARAVTVGGILNSV